MKMLQKSWPSSKKLVQQTTKALFLLFTISLLFITCKKTTIINNVVINLPDSSGLGLVETPDSIYRTLPVASVPPTGGIGLPSSYFLEIPSIPFNQGSQGSCAACAVAMAKTIVDHEHDNLPYSTNRIIYSPSYLFNQSIINPNDCVRSGSEIWRNCEILQSQGVCKLIEMNYNENDCSSQPTSSQRASAANHKSIWSRLPGINTSTIKAILNDGQPVIVAFRVDDIFMQRYWDPNNKNIVWANFGIPIPDLAHAVLLYGWDDQKQAFRMLNQWGSNWGDNGSIWVSYGMVENINIFYQAYTIKNSSTPTLELAGDLNFGDVTINSQQIKTFTLTNNSSADINVSSIVTTSPCSVDWSSGTIGAGEVKTIAVSFNPTSLGSVTRNIGIHFDASNVPLVITATGNCVQQSSNTKIISLSGNLFFGDVTVGTYSVKDFTISNTGNSPLTVSSISSAQGFSCAYNGIIQPNSSENVSVTFSPLNVQRYTGDVIVNSDATSGSNRIGAIGDGIQQVSQTRIISLSGSLSFGDVNIGQSRTKTLTIGNTGNSDLHVSSISSSNGAFTSTYSGTIQPNSSEQATIVFSPNSQQLYSGTITVISDKTAGTNTKNATGNGISTSSGPTTTPALGVYTNCGNGNTCSNHSFDNGIIVSRIINVNTANHTLDIEIRKCDGTAFNNSGRLNIVRDICNWPAYQWYISYPFNSGVGTVYVTIQENDMTGTKYYYPFISQGPNQDILSSAPRLKVQY